MIHAPDRLKSILRRTGSVLLLAQPFLALLVFLSVLAGTPPLWVSWLVALFPSIFRLSREERLWLRTPFDIPLIILTAGMLLGYFLSPVRELAGTAMNTYLAGLVFYYSLVGNSKARPGYWLAMAAFLMLVSLSLAVIIFSSGGGRQVSFNIWIYSLASRLHPFSQTGMSSNVLGVIFAVWLPVLLAIAIFPQKPTIRWAAAITAVLCGVLLVLSASGGGWIAALVGLFFVLLARGFKTLLGAAVAAMAVAGVTAPLWYGAQWIGTVLPYKDLLGREGFWRYTLEVLRGHPITGLGLCAWWSTVQKNFSTFSPGGPHSTYVQLYSDCGLLGLIALGQLRRYYPVP